MNIKKIDFYKKLRNFLLLSSTENEENFRKGISKNLLIISKPLYGKTYLLENFGFYKKELEKFGYDITFNPSEIVKLCASDTLREWRIKANVLCLIKEYDDFCQDCLKNTILQDKCFLRNLKNKVIFVDDIHNIRNGKKLKLLKILLYQSKAFVLTSLNLNISPSLKLLLKEKETLVLKIKEPFGKNGKLKFQKYVILSYDYKEEKDNFIFLTYSLLFFIFIVLISFNKIYYLFIIYAFFRYKNKILSAIKEKF